MTDHHRSGLDGQIGIVTGASSGIGHAVSLRLADAGVGLCLVAAPADQAPLEALAGRLANQGADVVLVAGDIADSETAARAVELTVETFGRLDLLVSNAGITLPGDALESTVEDFDRVMSVNVRGMYSMCVAAARAMAAKHGGAIVCTASTASLLGEEHEVAYNTSKGAVVSLARSLAVDLAPRGIRVNAVAPGWVETRLAHEVLADPKAWAKHRSRIPLDRAADPDEIARVIEFLLTDGASYMTGAVVYVDGGLTAGFRSTDWEASPRPLEPRPRVSD